MLARWRRSVEHRQAVIAGRRKYLRRNLVGFLNESVFGTSSVCSVFVQEYMAVDRNDAMASPS